ncbi:MULTISPECIES: ABC transporter permease [unclassified Archaeoglobus]|jgi:tungstate transport system permease protein|uniref:ABC transporter permease n=1 Tax=unclassified Archaeoglobus TaxID=2643606 RepID=UPI0025BCD955|nr:MULTISPECIES: ABC transporter permease [unclassified Archaeoglobus]
MELIISGIQQALHLILTANPDIMDIAVRSVRVSGFATLLATLWSLPIGVAIGLFNFFGKNVVKGLFNALLGIPTVVLGLILYLMLAPTGPFGFLGLIYTEIGISIGQAVLITPIIVSFAASSVELIEREIRELALTLGADNIDASIAVIREAASGILLALIAAFNRAVAELGIAIIIGGNIFVRDSALNTRVLTTAIQMYTTRGEIDMAIALGIILLSIVFAVSLLSNLLQRRLVRA